MKTVTNPTGFDIRATSSCGSHVCLIKAGITRDIPDSMFTDACLRGCLPADASVDNPATPVDESRVIMIESVMNDILDEGDEELLTRDGCPKASEIKNRFGSHSTEERETAWDNVKATRDKD
ncbi:hypothetical protein [Endozoicomonas ascidiicola]|uniref:hypothetical protein n=1 Tax=Endozoicomonas ascidiicola TaxID=1698521 RepID=UPI00082B5B32|nr:hypothetical protein [Endozoicomonas ascidiicola]